MKTGLTKWLCLTLLLALLGILLAGCMSGGTGNVVAEDPQDTKAQAEGATPAIPEKLTLSNGVPLLMVYDTKDAALTKMNIERYLEGVLAGEMRNDWPMEALKAQAILARTYAMKFVADKQSQYGGADISTDIREAQAYDADKINDRIKKAVEETRGMVMHVDETWPFAWFHAHAGGRTELATAALDYKEAEPAYTQSVASPDSLMAPSTVKRWTVSFTVEEVGKAAAETGVRTGTVKSIEIGERGKSTRAKTLVINGQTVSAPALRLALDSTKLKSTLLESVKVEGDKVVFTGKGYGHGVGMSQWGAYGMAQDGSSAEDIVHHYFKDVQISKLWD